MMNRATPFVFLLLRLISILMVFCLPKLGNLLINKGKTFRGSLCFNKDMLLAHKDNSSRDNLQPSQVIYMTRKDNPYRDNLRASRDCCTIRKGSLTILQVNLYSLTLWSNQGNLKDRQGNRGINLDRHMVPGGKPIRLNLWCNLSSLIFRLVKMLHNQDHLTILPQVNLVIKHNLAHRNRQANLLSRGNLVALVSKVNLFNQDNLHILLTLLSHCSTLCHSQINLCT